MSDLISGAPTSTRSYKDYSRPLWQRILLTREGAVYAALIIVIGWAKWSTLTLATTTTTSRAAITADSRVSSTRRQSGAL